MSVQLIEPVDRETAARGDATADLSPEVGQGVIWLRFAEQLAAGHGITGEWPSLGR